MIPPIKAPLRARSESVAVAMAQLDPVAVVRTALAHQRAGTYGVLSETALRWTNEAGDPPVGR